MAAKKKEADPAKADAYYEALCAAKIKAGVYPEEAQKVVARQRAEDEAAGLMPYLEIETTEPSSEG